MDLNVPEAMRRLLALIVTRDGWDALLAYLNALVPGFDLYAVSQEWIDTGCLLKARGSRGDLVIRFTA